MNGDSKAPGNARWGPGPAYRRVGEPRWPFLFRGLFPLVGLIAIALFGVTRFASHWIEEQARQNIVASLDAAGHSWAELSMSGQRARLSGAPPTAQAGDRALQTARDATCPTWLGPKVCAISVSGGFGATDSAAQGDADWPDLRGSIEEGILTLSGDVPDASARSGLIRLAQAAVEAGRVTRVVDELQLSGTTAPAGFSAAATRVVEAASLCTTGEAALTSGTLSIQCRTARAIEPEIRALVEPPLRGGSIGEVSLVVAEDAQACEQGLSALLVNDRIEFASGSATIVPSTAPLLDRIATVVDACPGVVRVEGHTDSTGDANANQSLSSARAEAVRSALGARGVPLDRLVAVGYGEASPVGDNDTAAGRARNRRIEFRVLDGAN